VMVVSVLERRPEIGLRRALGATKGDVRRQFLAESLLLSGAGGVGGVAIGAAITAAYARWYRDHRDLYKWAGAAAFASHRVGHALTPYRFSGTRKIVSANSAANRIEDPTLIADLDLLRQTNTAVYLDTAWVHLAYSDAAGGIEAVRAGLGRESRYADLLAGFEAIEAEQESRNRAPPVYWYSDPAALSSGTESGPEPRGVVPLPRRPASPRPTLR